MASNSIKDRLKFILLALSVFLLLLVLFSGDYNFTSIWALFRQEKLLSEKVEKLKVQNQLLSDQINSLDDNPAAYEKIAREEFGMSGKNETIYRILPTRPVDSPDSAASSPAPGE